MKGQKLSSATGEIKRRGDEKRSDKMKLEKMTRLVS